MILATLQLLGLSTQESAANKSTVISSSPDLLLLHMKDGLPRDLGDLQKPVLALACQLSVLMHCLPTATHEGLLAT